jgi:hypothetical protein
VEATSAVSFPTKLFTFTREMLLPNFFVAYIRVAFFLPVERSN